MQPEDLFYSQMADAMNELAEILEQIGFQPDDVRKISRRLRKAPRIALDDKKNEHRSS